MFAVIIYRLVNDVRQVNSIIIITDYTFTEVKKGCSFHLYIFFLFFCHFSEGKNLFSVSHLLLSLVLFSFYNLMIVGS